MRKIVVTYGLIAGAILSAMMLATVPFMERIGFDRGAIIGYTTPVAAFLMVYFVRIPREEAMMVEHFGEEYARYQARVGGLVPRIFPHN